jgi:hypothetical protein
MPILCQMLAKWQSNRKVMKRSRVIEYSAKNTRSTTTNRHTATVKDTATNTPISSR